MLDRVDPKYTSLIGAMIFALGNFSFPLDYRSTSSSFVPRDHTSLITLVCDFGHANLILARIIPIRWMDRHVFHVRLISSSLEGGGKACDRKRRRIDRPPPRVRVRFASFVLSLQRLHLPCNRRAIDILIVISLIEYIPNTGWPYPQLRHGRVRRELHPLFDLRHPLRQVSP